MLTYQKFRYSGHIYTAMNELIVVAISVLMLSACGPEKTDTAGTNQADLDNTVSSSRPVSKSRAKTLTSTPISFADALGETSKIIEIGPCPFLNDATILASVRSNFEITRREVSNSLCRWAYNLGFSIEVTIEDLSTAKPIADRKYNIDIDTIIDPQDGPGTNAAILNDTAWDKPIPFAYSFEKDNKLVVIRYTGFKTNLPNMRLAANEVAARMSSAPEIESQRRTATVTFEPCEVWTDADIKTVFSLAETAVVAQGMKGKTTCSWEVYEDGVSGQKTASFNFYKPEPGKQPIYEKMDYTPYTPDEETHYLRKSDSDFGLYIHILTPRPEGYVNVTVSSPTGDSSDAAKILQANLLSRMVP